MCFGLLCVSLVASVLVMQIQMKAERDVKSSDMLHEFNGTLNLMQMSYSQQTNVTGHLENDCREEREFKLTTEKDQLQNRFNTIEAELKKRNLERGCVLFFLFLILLKNDHSCSEESVFVCDRIPRE